MNAINKYFQVARESLDNLNNTTEQEVLQVAKMFAECFEKNGLVQLFGIKHGLEFSMELGYRAGGLMPFHQCKLSDLVVKGVITQEEYDDENMYDDTSLVERMLGLYNIHPEDIFMIISFEGCEAIAVETALWAKRNGHKVISVVSGQALKANKSHHESGKMLDEVSDLVVDVRSNYPNVNVSVGNVKMGQTDTLSGNIVAQFICCETYKYITSLGRDCPVLLSANVKGADVHNRAISDKYAGRWNSI